MDRYHGIKISDSGVYHVLKRNGLNRLPQNAKKRQVATRRYEKQVPSHHIQVDVKFLNLETTEGKKVRRLQYTAVDDATRVRALKIYERHTQAYAIDFIDYVVERFPFRLHTIRTDHGHEFQAKFHWNVEDLGMRHVYIKPRTPRLNGKVERSHRTDTDEFYQRLSFTDDVDQNQKLAEWEDFYNYCRPHGSLKGKPLTKYSEKSYNRENNCRAKSDTSQSGHISDKVFDQYNHVYEEDILDAAQRISGFLADQGCEVEGEPVSSNRNEDGD